MKYFLQHIARLMLIVFSINIAFGHHAEANFWKERQKELKLASLPSAYPILNPSRLVQTEFEHEFFKNSPTISPALKDLAQRRLAKKTPGKKNKNDALALELPSGFLTNVTIRDVQTGSEGPTVVILEDVHLNQEAQNHLSKALKSFGEEKGNSPALVGLEGAFGEMAFDVFKKTFSKNVGTMVADSFLETGDISGPAHAGFSSYPEAGQCGLEFRGVDDGLLYVKNVAAYKSAKELKGAIEKYLKEQMDQNKSMKNKLFRGELKIFDSEVEAYRAGTMIFPDYIERLSAYRTPASLNVETFLEAYAMEKKLDFKLVESERAKIIESLVRNLDKTNLETLVELSLAYQRGDIALPDYFESLREICQRHHVSLSQAPHFEDYIRYVLLTDGIKTEQLLKETSLLEKAVTESLAKSSAEKELMARARRLYLMEQLINFALTMDQWEEYKTTESHALVEPFEDFYRLAELRSDAMVTNLLKHDVPRTIVLVAGGFHTEGITNLLKKQGFGYIVASPKITKVDLDSGSRYLSVFDREKTPLEKIFTGQKLFLAPPVAPQEKLADMTTNASVMDGKIPPKEVQGYLGIPGDIKRAMDGTIEVQSTAGKSVIQFVPQGQKAPLNKSDKTRKYDSGTVYQYIIRSISPRSALLFLTLSFSAFLFVLFPFGGFTASFNTGPMFAYILFDPSLVPFVVTVPALLYYALVKKSVYVAQENNIRLHSQLIREKWGPVEFAEELHNRWSEDPKNPPMELPKIVDGKKVVLRTPMVDVEITFTDSRHIDIRMQSLFEVSFDLFKQEFVSVLRGHGEEGLPFVDHRANLQFEKSQEPYVNYLMEALKKKGGVLTVVGLFMILFALGCLWHPASYGFSEASFIISPLILVRILRPKNDFFKLAENFPLRIPEGKIPEDDIEDDISVVLCFNIPLNTERLKFINEKGSDKEKLDKLEEIFRSEFEFSGPHSFFLDETVDPRLRYRAFQFNFLLKSRKSVSVLMMVHLEAPRPFLSIQVMSSQYKFGPRLARITRGILAYAMEKELIEKPIPKSLPAPQQDFPSRVKGPIGYEIIAIGAAILSGMYAAPSLMAAATSTLESTSALSTLPGSAKLIFGQPIFAIVLPAIGIVLLFTFLVAYQIKKSTSLPWEIKDVPYLDGSSDGKPLKKKLLALEIVRAYQSSLVSVGEPAPAELIWDSDQKFLYRIDQIYIYIAFNESNLMSMILLGNPDFSVDRFRASLVNQQIIGPSITLRPNRMNLFGNFALREIEKWMGSRLSKQGDPNQVGVEFFKMEFFGIEHAFYSGSFLAPQNGTFGEEIDWVRALFVHLLKQENGFVETGTVGKSVLITSIMPRDNSVDEPNRNTIVSDPESSEYESPNPNNDENQAEKVIIELVPGVIRVHATNPALGQLTVEKLRNALLSQGYKLDVAHKVFFDEQKFPLHEPQLKEATGSPALWNPWGKSSLLIFLFFFIPQRLFAGPINMLDDLVSASGQWIGILIATPLLGWLGFALNKEGLSKLTHRAMNQFQSKADLRKFVFGSIFIQTILLGWALWSRILIFIILASIILGSFLHNLYLDRHKDYFDVIGSHIKMDINNLFETGTYYSGKDILNKENVIKFLKGIPEDYLNIFGFNPKTTTTEEDLAMVLNQIIRNNNSDYILNEYLGLQWAKALKEPVLSLNMPQSINVLLMKLNGSKTGDAFAYLIPLQDEIGKSAQEKDPRKQVFTRGILDLLLNGNRMDENVRTVVPNTFGFPILGLKEKIDHTIVTARDFLGGRGAALAVAIVNLAREKAIKANPKTMGTPPLVFVAGDENKTSRAKQETSMAALKLAGFTVVDMGAVPRKEEREILSVYDHFYRSEGKFRPVVSLYFTNGTNPESLGGGLVINGWLPTADGGSVKYDVENWRPLWLEAARNVVREGISPLEIGGRRDPGIVIKSRDYFECANEIENGLTSIQEIAKVSEPSAVEISRHMENVLSVPLPGHILSQAIINMVPVEPLLSHVGDWKGNFYANVQMIRDDQDKKRRSFYAYILAIYLEQCRTKNARAIIDDLVDNNTLTGNISSAKGQASFFNLGEMKDEEITSRDLIGLNQLKDHVAQDNATGLSHDLVVLVHDGARPEDVHKIMQWKNVYVVDVSHGQGANFRSAVDGRISYKKILLELHATKGALFEIAHALKNKQALSDVQINTYSRLPDAFELDPELLPVWRMLVNMGLGWVEFKVNSINHLIQEFRAAADKA